MRNYVDRILSLTGIQPVLLDIGASGSPPSIWDQIAQRSIYVGFDPDSRDIRNVDSARYQKFVIVNDAVIDTPDSAEAKLFLTASPYCSSLLPPDHASLSNYLFSDLFHVQKETTIATRTLDDIMNVHTLPRIDWFKTDSQGMDLRLFNSLRREVRDQVLALDVEPGLIDAYVGEDLFIDVHRELTSHGFWLSWLNVPGSVRMRRSSLERLQSTVPPLDETQIKKGVQVSPCWCEARYLRSTEWLADNGMPEQAYVLLWVFSMICGQFGFCTDLVVDFELRFGRGDLSRLMAEGTAQAIRGQAKFLSRFWRWMRRALNA